MVVAGTAGRLRQHDFPKYPARNGITRALLVCRKSKSGIEEENALRDRV